MTCPAQILHSTRLLQLHRVSRRYLYIQSRRPPLNPHWLDVFLVLPETCCTEVMSSADQDSEQHSGADDASNDGIQLAPLSQEALAHIASHGQVRKAAEDGTLKELLATDSTLKAAVGGDQVLQQTDHETLKYHLLGPSLTKAGQDTVDQTRVSEIIYNASKGSKFFNNEEVKDRNLTEKINRILARKRQIDRLDLTPDRRKADDYIASLELSRDLSQTIVHIDCDAFYAAVEELDRPELRDIPMAVGKGVLTTCNYHARKFGCRSGMAGFVAMKLCPELICLPLNFDKYTAKAQEVRSVLAEYDPRFQSSSIDEAYCNITDYCTEHSQSPEDVVSQLRAEVFARARITVSAGIAPNAMLAKISSNRNKPNGQFRLPPDRASVLSFMRTLPTRKVIGIGRVFERELDALGIRTCGDIYPHRHLLSRLFGDKAFRFLTSIYLGLGATSVRPAEESERKSVGTESTFRDMSAPEELRAKLRHIAEELEGDMRRTECKGRTLVLKVKFNTYEVLTRQVAPPYAVCKAEELFRYGWPIMEKLMKEHEGFTLRLMGLRCTHLVSTRRGDVGSFFGLGNKDGADGGTNDGDGSRQRSVDDEGWEVWPAEEFEEEARMERQAEMDEAEELSQEHDRNGVESRPPDESTKHQPHRHDTILPPPRLHGRNVLPNPAPASISASHPSVRNAASAQPKPWESCSWRCPICTCPQPMLTGNNLAFNAHVDLCLSRGVIQDAVREGASVKETSTGTAHTTTNSASEDLAGGEHCAETGKQSVLVSASGNGNGRNGTAGKKRGRPRIGSSGGGGNVGTHSEGGNDSRERKRLFFA